MTSPIPTHETLARQIVEAFPHSERLGGLGREQEIARVAGQLAGHPQQFVVDPEVVQERTRSDATPRAKWLRDDWLKTFRPWVESVRERVWNDPAPPFDVDAWDTAVEWILAEVMTEAEARIEAEESDTADVLASCEHRDRMERLRADMEWIGERVGVPLRLEFATLPALPYRHKDTRRVVQPRPEGTLGVIAEAVEAMAALSGFFPSDLTRLILTGEPPAELPRTRVQGIRVARSAPDGSLRQFPRVTVEFYVDDIRHEDLRRLHGEIRDTWEALRADSVRKGARLSARETARRSNHREGVMRGMVAQAQEELRYPEEGDTLPKDSSPIRQRVYRPTRPESAPRGRLSDKDVELSRMLDDLGGPPTQNSELTWAHVVEKWEAAGYDAIKPDSLRKRWERLQRKRK